MKASGSSGLFPKEGYVWRVENDGEGEAWTSLLNEGLEQTPAVAYFLHEEEVPRAGVRVSQAYQRTRWTDGRVVVWLGARKRVRRGEGSSGLLLDRLVEVRKT